MLQEVGALASALSLPAACGIDEGCSVDSRMAQLMRLLNVAFVKFKASLGFCWRGLRITGQDLLEVALLFGAAASCKPATACPCTYQALPAPSG